MSSKLPIDWESNIEQLVAYSETRGWSVFIHPGKFDEAQPYNKRVLLSERHNSEIMCYYFLHELGHMIMSYDQKDYDVKYKVLNERSHWSQTYRVGRVEEEIEAWNIGRHLARTLKLSIDESKFEETKAKAISSYMIWCTQRKHPHKRHSKPRAA